MHESEEQKDDRHVAWRAFLLTRGGLDAEDLERAQGLATETGENIEWVLVNLGLLSEQGLADAYAAFTGLPKIPRDALPAEALAADVLSGRFLHTNRVLPVALTDADAAIAVADPLDPYAAHALGFALGRQPKPHIATRSDIEEVLARLYPAPAPPLAETIGGEDDDIGRLRDLASEAPVIRFVNTLIANALEARASDIHIEPTENRLRVRYRIDGVLSDVDPPAKSTGAAIISRIKIMADLDIAERRLPQDGRIRIVVRGQALDIRVSTSPTAYGESVVMRLLDREALVLDLLSLGFSGPTLERLRKLLTQPHGIVAVTGPTGSGKTTTLYAALQELNTADKKILTIEDPIEYVIEGINQAQAKPDIGYTFAAALRSFLRQDPDVMMVGEIRDRETAEVAAQAALTGHLVLSTLHTNDAPSGLTRLLDMGVEDFLLTASILGMVAQRLVRKLCPHCREAYTPSEELIQRYDLKKHAGGGALQLYRARGCAACGNIGYRGRIAIVEVMVMTEALSKLLLARRELGALRQQAIADGMTPMLEDGVAKALAGTTTLEEVLRVIRDSQ